MRRLAGILCLATAGVAVWAYFREAYAGHWALASALYGLAFAVYPKPGE